MSWVEGIGGLFDLNRRRLQVRKQPESFAAWDRELRSGRSGDWRGSALRSWGARPCLKPAKRCCAASRDTGKG